jgi:hypothetical protein
MKKLSIGIGWIVWCIWSTNALCTFAEEAPKKESGTETAKPPATQPATQPAAAVPIEQSAAERSSQPIVQPTQAATAESTPVSAGPAVQSETASASTSTASAASMAQGDTQPAPKNPELVPEAVPTKPSTHPSTRVEIGPSSSSEKQTSEGNRKILIGTWTKKIVFATDDNSFRFQPKGGVQAKFTLATNPDDDTNGDEPFDGTGFSFQRARLGFQAWFLNFGKFNLDTEWRTGKADLLEYFVDFGPNNGEGAVAVRVGLFKPYFSRQFLQSSFQLSMIENAMAWSSLDFVSTPDDTEVNTFKYKPFPLIQRQLGIALQGFAANGIEYGVGIWNGSDGYATDADFMYGGRIAVHPMGLAGGSALRIGDESDSEISSSPALSIGLAAFIEDRNDATIDLPGSCPSEDLFSMCPYEDYKLRSGLDIAFKYAGLSLEGEFFILKTWAKQEAINSFALEEFNRDAPGLSGYLQAGYMIVPKRLEFVGRFDALDENIEIRGVQFYPTVGVTYFVLGNNLKAQFQYRINIGSGYIKGEDAMYVPLTHDFLFLLQASI